MAYYSYYRHQSKKLIWFLMFVFLVFSLMETSLTEGREVYRLKDIGRSRSQVENGGQMKRLETLAELLPRGPVPPSAPSPDINWSMLVSHLSICIVGCYNLHKFWTCLYQFFFFFTMSLLLCCVYNNLIFCVNLSLFHHLLHLSGANLIDSTCEGYKFFISYLIIMDKKIFYNISYFCSPFFH